MRKSRKQVFDEAKDRIHENDYLDLIEAIEAIEAMEDEIDYRSRARSCSVISLMVIVMWAVVILAIVYMVVMR